MPKTAPTLYDAVTSFMGPLVAEYGRIIDEGFDDTRVEIRIAGYVHRTTLASLKALDRAHTAAFEAKCKRQEKRATGSLL